MTEETKNGEPAPAAPEAPRPKKTKEMPEHAKILLDAVDAIEDAPPLVEDVDDLEPAEEELSDADDHGETISHDTEDPLHAYSSHSEHTVDRDKLLKELDGKRWNDQGIIEEKDEAGDGEAEAKEEEDEDLAAEAPIPPDWEDPGFAADIDTIVDEINRTAKPDDVAKLLEKLGLAKHQKGLPAAPTPDWLKGLPAPPPAPPRDYHGPEEPFKIGDRVRVIGLTSRTDLNGALGAVTKQLSEGRYGVKVEEPECVIRAKPRNLEPVGELPKEDLDDEPPMPEDPSEKALRGRKQGDKPRDPYTLDPVPPPDTLPQMLKVLRERHFGAFLEILERRADDDAEAIQIFADEVGGWADPEDEDPITNEDGELNDHLCRRGPDDGVPRAAVELILEIIQFDHVGRRVLGSREMAVEYASKLVSYFNPSELIMVSAPYNDFLWNDNMLHRGIILLDDEKVGRLIIDYDGSDDVHAGGYGPPGRNYYDLARTPEEDSDASDYESHLPKEQQWGEHQKDKHLSASEEDRRGVTQALDAAELLAKEGKLGRDHSLLTAPGVVPKTVKVRKLPE